MSSTTQDPPHSGQNQRSAKMSQADCFRALGVASNASWDEVRQAYKDLVRVWHPDRFQSDPELQDRAEQQLQKVNEAYSTLRNSQTFKPADAGPSASVPQRFRRLLGRFLRILPIRAPRKVVWLGVVCVAPLVLGGLLVKALRCPAWAPCSSVRWRSIPRVGAGPSERPVAAASEAIPQKDDVIPSDPPRRRTIGTLAPALPVNGTELLWTRRSGAGELWVSNETSQDALATLVQAHTESPLRAIYIQSKNKVCMRNIAPGLYDLLADVGDNWDPRHIRFQTGRQALDRSGPFECIDVTSTQGTSGCKYEIVLRTR